ncbi:unannotated protein [freshwater metagenome]|uniref:Unannotated protein n=1 Tax=freshwater metagenome TaxID=449393 RepID=A0A6J6HY01_9ZZZZ
MFTAAPVAASILITEMLSGRSPKRSDPASAPSNMMLYRPSTGEVKPPWLKILPIKFACTPARFPAYEIAEVPITPAKTTAPKVIQRSRL